jgi:hypothetical protein
LGCSEADPIKPCFDFGEGQITRRPGHYEHARRERREPACPVKPSVEDIVYDDR